MTLDQGLKKAHSEGYKYAIYYTYDKKTIYENEVKASLRTINKILLWNDKYEDLRKKDWIWHDCGVLHLDEDQNTQIIFYREGEVTDF